MVKTIILIFGKAPLPLPVFTLGTTILEIELEASMSVLPEERTHATFWRNIIKTRHARRDGADIA